MGMDFATLHLGVLRLSADLDPLRETFRYELK